jgi:DNA-binding CsgD family transcriptional regulator
MRVWPFEGRGEELAAIEAAFASPAVNAVVLSGPAGVGKSRLARQALLRLRCRRTDWIAATRSGATIPFGALAHLLPDRARPGLGQVEVIRAVCAQVSGWGGRNRVALGFDDAHLLDDASAATLAHLVTRSLAFVILTVRSGEPLPDAITRACRDDQAHTVVVAPLPDDVVDRLIDHSTAGRVDTLERHRLHRVAQGNPLALRELLYGAVAGGLTDLVASRLDALPAAIRTVVELVACAEPVPLTMVERLAEPGALGAAEDSGLVAVDTDGRRTQARLAHPIYGEVLRGRLPLSRARQVYAGLAAGLLATPLRRRDDPLRAALWQVDGGTISRLDVVRDGARLAIGRAGLVLAERLARAAREAEPGPEADRLLAEILEYQGRSGEAAAILPAEPPPDPTGRIRWAVTSAENLYWGGGDVARAHRALDQAAGEPTAEAARCWILFFDGRCVPALRVARMVLARADADPQALTWAAAAGAAACGFLGDLDEARAIHRRAAPVAQAHAATLPWAAFEIDVAACLAHLACGELIAAESIAVHGYRDAVAAHVPMMVAGWALYRGLVAATRGHLADAGTLLTEALAGFQTSDTFRLTRCCLAALAWVSALRGDSPTAREWLTQADQLPTAANQIFAPWHELWHAWVARSAGAVGDAASHAVDAADLARTAAMPTVQARALYDHLRLTTTPDQSLLTRLAALSGPAAQRLSTAAHALSNHDQAKTLARVADDLAARGEDLLAAEAATVAARRLRKQGHRELAELTAVKATALRATCHAHTPLLATEDLGTVLTPREREVLLLAAEHTSKQIAARLGLAVPTVNNTLARAYTKLGITGRTQLRALLQNAA